MKKKRPKNNRRKFFHNREINEENNINATANNRNDNNRRLEKKESNNNKLTGNVQHIQFGVPMLNCTICTHIFFFFFKQVFVVIIIRIERVVFFEGKIEKFIILLTYKNVTQQRINRMRLKNGSLQDGLKIQKPVVQYFLQYLIVSLYI